MLAGVVGSPKGGTMLADVAQPPLSAVPPPPPDSSRSSAFSSAERGASRAADDLKNFERSMVPSLPISADDIAAVRLPPRASQ
jgi:hypothetical protein